MSKSRRQQVGELLHVTGTQEAMDKAIGQLTPDELNEVITTMESFSDLFGLDDAPSFILAALQEATPNRPVSPDGLVGITIEGICEGATLVKPKMSIAQAEALFKQQYPTAQKELENKNPDAARFWKGFEAGLIATGQLEDV